MPNQVTRREVLTAGLAVAVGKHALAAAPEVMAPRSVKPVVISSANGNKFRNGGPRTCVEEAFLRITKGEDVLDSLIAGVNILELDPEEDGVGYGGLPNADGVVQLDASCMHGPLRRAGAVGALEGVRTPSLVARAVMQQTDHHLLVGQGAQSFARGMGFTIEADLNTEHSRKTWIEWKRRVDPSHYLDPEKREAEADRVRVEMIAAGLLDPHHCWGTINCDGLGPNGDLCGVTTTSGLAWKIPGRLGDSPILGAGLFVDGAVGAAGSTGRGEANLYNLCSYLIVELIRQGRHPKDACIEALRRIKSNTIEKRLLNSEGNPRFGISFYSVNRKGEYAGVSMYSKNGGKPSLYAVCTENGPQTLQCDSLLGEAPVE